MNRLTFPKFLTRWFDPPQSACLDSKNEQLLAFHILFLPPSLDVVSGFRPCNVEDEPRLLPSATCSVDKATFFAERLSGDGPRRIWVHHGTENNLKCSQAVRFVQVRAGAAKLHGNRLVEGQPRDTPLENLQESWHPENFIYIHLELQVPWICPLRPRSP